MGILPKLMHLDVKYDFSHNKDQFENGSNMIISIVYRMLIDFIKQHKVLPPVLFLNLDNCGRENKGVFLSNVWCFKSLVNF